ncbi:hypothetical protein ACB092_10G144400 [Castanea dentata]
MVGTCPFSSCTCGKCVCNINKRLNDLQVRESVMKFLMGVNDSFPKLGLKVLLMDPIPPLSKVYCLLIQEETQRSIPNASVVKVDSTILVARVSTDHVTHGSDLVNSGEKGKDRSICTHCGKTGHTVDKCYKLHGFPPGFKSKNRPSMAHQVSSSSTTPHASDSPMANAASSSNSANVAMVGTDFSHCVFAAQVVNRKAYGSNTWVLDTSATNHLVCFVDLLTSITTIRQSLIQLPNGESAQVTHIGTVVLSSSFILKNVFCVPSFSFNLLSVSSLTQSQPYCCVFLSAYCFVQNLTSWKTIEVGKALDGLYLLQLDCNTPSLFLKQILDVNNISNEFYFSLKWLITFTEVF